MSLLSFLKHEDVKERFRQEFRYPKLSSAQELLAPPMTKRYSLVGTAFDYLLRFSIKRINPHAIERGWIAEAALWSGKLESASNSAAVQYKIVKGEIIRSQGKNIRYNEACKNLANARKLYLSFLKDGKISDKLLKHILLLAQLDPIVRSSFIDPNLGTVHDEDMKDLKRLISKVDFDVFRTKKACLLNPTFGVASPLVGGADADLVVNEMLIDVKTTKHYRLLRDDFNQLVGYYALSRIGHLDGAPPKHKVSSLGIYFSRHAYLHVMKVKDIVNEPTFPTFLRWFEKRANQELKAREKRLRDLNVKPTAKSKSV